MLDLLFTILFCVLPIGVGIIIAIVSTVLALYWAIAKAKSDESTTSPKSFKLDDQKEIN